MAEETALHFLLFFLSFSSFWRSPCRSSGHNPPKARKEKQKSFRPPARCAPSRLAMNEQINSISFPFNFIDFFNHLTNSSSAGNTSTNHSFHSFFVEAFPWAAKQQLHQLHFFSHSQREKKRVDGLTAAAFTTCFLHKNQINLVFMLSASCSINLLL